MCYIYFCILVDIGIKINKICTSYGKRDSVIRIGGTKGMTITEKLNQQGFKVSEPRYLSDDEVHLSIVGKPSFTKLETANWLYNQTQPMSKESLIKSFGVVLHKDTALTDKLVENWKKVRKVTYRNLRYFEKAVYISKEYGVIRVVDHTESPSRIVEQLEDRVMTGESKEDLSWMDSEDFIALYIDELTELGSASSLVTYTRHSLALVSISMRKKKQANSIWQSLESVVESFTTTDTTCCT